MKSHSTQIRNVEVMVIYYIQRYNCMLDFEKMVILVN